MSHKVITPLSYPERNPSHQSLSLMEKKLEAAEEETRQLLGQISDTINKGAQPGNSLGNGDFVGQYSILNFEDIVGGKGNLRSERKNKDVKARSLKNYSQTTTSMSKIAAPPLSQSHIKGNNPSPAAQPNYEALISRMCRTESAIQTLKLNLLNLKGNYDLKKKQQMDAEEKLISVTEQHTEDVNRLERSLSKTKQELNQELEVKARLEAEIKQLKEESEEVSKAKSESDAAVLGIGESNEKLNKKIQSLQEDLSREKSLRESLEESHNTLLARIRDMEGVVETERSQLRNLTENSNLLQAEVVKTSENLKAEQDNKQMAAKKCEILEKELGERLAELGEAEEERRGLRSEISKLKSQYEDLISQLEMMEKLMAEHQEVHSEVQAKNRRLREALETAEQEKVNLIETGKDKSSEYRKMEEKTRQLQLAVKQLGEENEDLVANREKLEKESLESTSLLKSREREFRQATEALEAELNELRTKVADLQQDKERATNDKETLLAEVNSAVDGMSEERWKLKTEIQEARLEIQRLTQANKHLEAEHNNLQERLQTLSSLQNSQKKMDSALKEAVDQKNRLAYDKGRLQSQVSQLQAEVDGLANTRTEVIHLHKQRENLESKYLKCQKEVGDYKIRIQRLENQAKQSQDSAERRDKDFTLAIQSRDEALKENCKLLEQLNDAGNQESHKVLSLEKRLEDSNHDNRKLTQTLEAVMASHSQLQSATENLQVELGQRDSRISQLTTEKSQAKAIIRDLQQEAELLKERLVAVETLESNELEPLRKALKQCRDDNTKMADSLEDVLDSNCELQTTVDKLRADVERKEQLIAKLKDAREKEYKTAQNEIRSCEERLNAVCCQLRQEREKSIKKSNKDTLEMKKQNDEMAMKNGELSRANMELRHKLTEQEVIVKEIRQKLTNQKTQIDHMTKAKKQMAEHVKHLKFVREELDVLEKVRDEYVEKNQQQAQSISNLMTQLGSLQSELRQLAQAQFKTQELVHRKEGELLKERQLREDITRKYMDSRRNKEETEKQNKELEDKIKLANEESLEVSRNLEEAHDWFKTKFDCLQEELTTSKHIQAELERDNINQKKKLDEERQRAKTAAERAKQMIKSSRKTIGRLSDYAELTDADPKDQLMSLHDEIDKEMSVKGRQSRSKSKMSSSQQLEALISRYSKS